MPHSLFQKMTRLPDAIGILFLLSFIICSGCRQKAGDPQKFTVLSFDELTEKNAPKGLMIRNGEVRLTDGFGFEHSSDSTMALLIDPDNKGGGTTAMRCDCDGLIKTGCIVVLEGIITCKPVLCTSCKPVLQIYDGFLRTSAFKGRR